MKIFFGKETDMEKYSKLHVELVYNCVYRLQDAMKYFYEGQFELLDKEVKEISRIEREADEIRRKMEIGFYNGAFLPFDREDRIILAELVDAVSDASQAAAYAMSLGKINFPQSFREDFIELADKSCETVSVLRESVLMLNTELSGALNKAHEVEEKEEQGDKIERKIISKLYDEYRRDEISILQFIELKNITEKIGNIADRAEDASDRIPIIVAKRRG